MDQTIARSIVLPYYDRTCLEIVIGADRTAAARSALKALADDHRLLIHDTLEAVCGSTSTGRYEEIAVRHSRFGPGHWVLDAAIRKSGPPYAIVFTLKSMTSLQTDWGRRYRRGGNSYVAAYIFSSSLEAFDHARQAVAAYSKGLSTAVGRKTAGTLVTIATINDRYDQFKDRPHDTPELDDRVVAVSLELADKRTREVILRARQAKTPTRENIARSLGRAEDTVEPQLRAAVKAGLLNKRLHVRCPGCTQAIATVDSEKALEALVKSGAQCTTCHRKVTKTAYANSYDVSAAASELLDGSRWMGVHLRQALAPFGVSGRARTEVIDGPNEIDLVANIDGDLLLMELKDGRFSIGHAYSFVGKCSQYKPDLAVIVATDDVDEEVIGYLANTGVGAEVITSLDHLDRDLEAVFSVINGRRLARFISQIPWTESVALAALSPLGVEIEQSDNRHLMLRTV